MDACTWKGYMHTKWIQAHEMHTCAGTCNGYTHMKWIVDTRIWNGYMHMKWIDTHEVDTRTWYWGMHTELCKLVLRIGFCEWGKGAARCNSNALYQIALYAAEYLPSGRGAVLEITKQGKMQFWRLFSDNKNELYIHQNSPRQNAVLLIKTTKLMHQPGWITRNHKATCNKLVGTTRNHLTARKLTAVLCS